MDFLVTVRGYGLLAVVVGLCVAVVAVAGCFGSVDVTADPVASATTTAIPTVIPSSVPSATVDPNAPTATPEPPGWWTVAQSTWNDTFEVTLEIYGASTITSQSEFFARTRLRNVSDESSVFVRWTQYDPAVPLSIVLPHEAVDEDVEQVDEDAERVDEDAERVDEDAERVDEDAERVDEDPTPRPALRLIQLRADDDPAPSISSPEVRHESLDEGDSIEREVSWDLTVGVAGQREREPAPDGVYTLRADFYPEDGEASPGLPDVLLEFAIRLERGIFEDRDQG